MLTTQARLAMKNDDPVRLVGDLYHIVKLKRIHGDKIVAVVKKIGINQRHYKPIEVDVNFLEVVHEI
ncbi:hypothetical protein L2520_03815 [Limosilactobacillus vaginalis]|uniref:Uncharacterized protein n=1 Tax=Limosilactobacillus vaginalis TaxID=1633 RepID=A0ABT4K8A4_9LACO|nr:hypothetical protein [Limosilactobacillus vaginalis]MCZ3746550.1 hypothetical protein [Limosilactobacillus vaginalis]MCZ3751558.1 hypothetical protein [Limosilactobacillus vaginalis]MCZ3753244.1 hypothetical protein [Limosilactobacillus vaginalis]MCZ3755070.1 hypothetical protein [Limosilactobacillus vaginalis]MCZ3756730.1 hypothetical protein [Limosilactobacillus vaginalis]